MAFHPPAASRPSAASRGPRPFRLSFVAAAFAVLARLSDAPAQPGTPAPAPPPSASEELRGLADSVVEELRAAFAEIGGRATSRGVRSEAEEWSEELPREMRENLEKSDPKSALFDGWALAEQALVHLEGTGGARDFKGERASAARAVRDARDRLVGFATEHLPEESLAEVAGRVRDFAIENPYTGRPSWIRRVAGFRPLDFTLVRVGQDTIRTLTDLPLAPGRAARGFERGAAGLRDISTSADRFTEEVRRLPARVREELDATLARIDASTTLTATLERAREITENVRATSEAAPEAAREARETLARAESAASEIAGAANAAGAAAGEADRLVASVDGLVRTLDERAAKANSGRTAAPGSDSAPLEPERITEAAAALETSAREVRLLVESISELVERIREDDAKARASEGEEGAGREGASTSRGFDPLDYAEAARALQGAAAELRGALSEARSLVESEAPAARLDEIESRATRAMDRLLARAMILACVLFALAVAFVAINRRRAG